MDAPATSSSSLKRASTKDERTENHARSSPRTGFVPIGSESFVYPVSLKRRRRCGKWGGGANDEELLKERKPGIALERVWDSKRDLRRRKPGSGKKAQAEDRVFR